MGKFSVEVAKGKAILTRKSTEKPQKKSDESSETPAVTPDTQAAESAQKPNRRRDGRDG